jgi:hypothetical protein
VGGWVGGRAGGWVGGWSSQTIQPVRPSRAECGNNLDETVTIQD